MWSRQRDTVTCIACDASVDRSAAREYDRFGDRFNRRDKRFEYLCKPCHQVQCHQPRRGLERTLAEAGAGDLDQGEFLRRYTALAQTDRQERQQD